MKQITKLILLITLFVSLPSTADIAIIVNISNPSDSLSVVDLKKIYRVRVSEFVDNSPIVLSYQPSDREITRKFVKHAVGQSMAQLNRVWARKIFSGRMRRPIKLSDDTMVIQWIEKNRNGIGYIDEVNLTDNVKKIATIKTPLH
ncbi:MAG: hypothetical protein JKY67_12515 [Pseudomonadales bacterium]|nr:hypothetical protein [Pseudomonadales bacterium]